MARIKRIVKGPVQMTAFADREWEKALEHVITWLQVGPEVPPDEIACTLRLWADWFDAQPDSPVFALAECSQAVSDHTKE